MVSASSIAVAMTLAAVASAQALPPAPSYYWAGRATPDFVITPLPTVHFSWGIRWTPDNSTAYVVGTFNYSAAHGYVGVGTKSARGMDGLNIICSAVGAVIRCDDWDGAGYHIDLAGKSLTRVLSSRITPDVNQVVFERIAVQNGTDLGHFAWGSTARVIWAFGPGSGEGAGEHPGEGIASNLMDFKTGKKPVVANPGRHLVPAMIAVGVTVLIAIIVQVTTFARIPVHHLARDIFGWAMLVVYIVLFCWYVIASIPDYVDMGVMGAEARAMGDGAAAALAVLLLSGVRRFLPQDVLGVSHERMIAYHTVAGLAFMACTLGHAWAMVEFYFLPYMFRWVAGEKFAKLPGTIAFVLSVFVVLPAIVRFHISYRFFRITHFLWVPVAIMTILHVPRLLWFCLPGLIGLVLNFVYGRVANCGAVIEHVAHDQATMCVTIDISRPYYSFTATGDCPEMGIAPAQWFYLCQLGMSLAWHPFSVARAEVKADANGKRRQHLRFVIKETHGLAGGGGPVMSLLNTVANGAGIRKTVDNARGFGSWTTKVWAAAAAADSEDSARAAFGSMWIEGPFGRVQTPLKTYQNIILVSGGIGVTPNLLILQYIAHMSAAAVARGQPAPWRHVLWTWVNREPGMFAMFAEDLVKYAAMLKTAGVELTLRNFCTGKGPGLSESAGGLGFDVTVGARPQYETEFREFAATCTSGSKAHAAMYSCGPVPMIDAAGDAASAASSSTQLAIHHHSEVFDV